MNGRLGQQIEFILEIDRLKRVVRQTWILGRERKENSAEHSWHLALMAVVLAEHADVPIDALKVVKMLLVHDVVEIDAGDTYCYDPAANVDKAQREGRAAERIFAMLPADQGRELRGLWEEFERRETAESRFANAMDRVQPLLLNFHTGGEAWLGHGVTRKQVEGRMAAVKEGSAGLGEFVARVIEEAVGLGYLKA